MKIFLVSNKNMWSDRLSNKLKKEFDCSYFCDDSYKDFLRYNSPDWVFFLHWSKIVPEEIYKNHRCVVLHTGNLPKGRGGTPIQNQILDGVIESKVNAIVMDKEIDSGDVYCSAPITLQGSLTDIWMSISDISYGLIKKCVNGNIVPKKQVGQQYTYLRNKNNKLPLENSDNILDIHKFIQMLDAEGYPKSHFDIGNYRLEFSRSKLSDNKILSDVSIRKINE